MVSSLYDSLFSAKTSVMSSKVIPNRTFHFFAIAAIRFQLTNSTTTPFYILLKGQQEAPVAGAALESDTGDTMHQAEQPHEGLWCLLPQTHSSQLPDIWG